MVITNVRLLPIPRPTRAFALALAAAAMAVLAGSDPVAAAWKGKRGPIVFAGGEAVAGNGLWSKSLHGRLRHLTFDSSDGQPQSSPNGRLIVFVRTVDEPLPEGGGGSFPALHVFRARSDGSSVREVTDGPVFDRFPSFAPNGKRILFSRFTPEAGGDIYSVRLDGSGLHQITSGSGDDRDPVLSPTGRLIAFDRFVEGHTRHVYTMRPDGSRIKDATPNLAAWSSQPDFSPSGNRIVFVRGFPGDERTADLFTMRPDGKLRRRLTGQPNHPTGGFSNPAYSPDGRLVVSQFERSGGFSKLRVVRVRDRSLVATLGGRPMARTPDARDPVWLPR